MYISRPNDDGIVFIHGEQHKYYVVYSTDGEYFSVIETGRQIFDRMDMDDCYDIHINRLLLINKTRLVPCEFYGTRHNWDDALRMEIRRRSNGKVLDVGYGSDH